MVFAGTGSHQAIEKYLHFLSLEPLKAKVTYNGQGMVLYSFWTEFSQIIHVQWNIILVFRYALVAGRLSVRAHLWTATILL